MLRPRLLPAATLLAGALIAVCASCSRSRVIAVQDLDREQVIVLKFTGENQRVAHLEVRGEGRLEGTAEISLVTDRRVDRTEKLSGDVSFLWKTDWYAPTAELRYRPLTPAKGSLKLTYHFGIM